jgi:tripartite-type tricarboxylate transporter receptor subunit TctC
MDQTRRALVSSGLLGALATAAPSWARAAAWPQRAVKFIVPFGPGAGADIGARVFADKLQAQWRQPVIVENRPGGDSIVAITTFLNANDDHTFLFAPAGNFTVHPFVYSKLSYDPNDLVPIARVSNTILAVAVKADSPFTTIREFTEAAKKAPGKYNGAMVQGVTEFTFWGYEAAEGLSVVQVPYRDINSAAVDLGEGRIDIAMLSYAMLQSQVQAGRIRLIVVNNGVRAPATPDVPTAREAGYPSLELEGLVGLFGITALPNEVKEKIAADIKIVSGDPTIAERLKATGQVVNYGGPKEFGEAIAAQRAKIAATVRAINFKPKL